MIEFYYPGFWKRCSSDVNARGVLSVGLWKESGNEKEDKTGERTLVDFVKETKNNATLIRFKCWIGKLWNVIYYSNENAMELIKNQKHHYCSCEDVFFIHYMNRLPFIWLCYMRKLMLGRWLCGAERWEIPFRANKKPGPHQRKVENRNKRKTSECFKAFFSSCNFYPFIHPHDSSPCTRTESQVAFNVE